VRAIIATLRDRGTIDYETFTVLYTLMLIEGIDSELIPVTTVGMHMAGWIKLEGEGDNNNTVQPGPNIPKGKLDDIHIFHLTDALKELEEKQKLSN
jgi:hypothetical protein